MCLIEPLDITFLFAHMDAIYAGAHVSYLL